MLLLLIAGLGLSIACAATVGTGSKSAIGKALCVVAAAIGITVGVTAGTVASGMGASVPTIASVAILTGSLTLIAGNAVIRKLIKKSGVQRQA